RRVRAAGAARSWLQPAADGRVDGSSAAARAASPAAGHPRRPRALCPLRFCSAVAAADADGNLAPGHLPARRGGQLTLSMNDMLPSILAHLEQLVSFDTRNPPRAITTGGIFDYLRAQLPDFRIEVSDHGAGAVSLLAVRGTPSRLFNVHLDTVPSSPHWSADPHLLRVDGERATGLGA